MKKYIYLLLILIISHGCSNNTFTINAETNHDEDLNVFLVKLGESNLPVVIDSTKVFEGKFSFTDSISVPEMHYVVFDKQRENVVSKLIINIYELEMHYMLSILRGIEKGLKQTQHSHRSTLKIRILMRSYPRKAGYDPSDLILPVLFIVLSRILM